MKKESLYAAIINKLAEGVYYVDKDRNIQVWNRSAEKISGYSAEEVLAKPENASLLDHIGKSGSRMGPGELPIDRVLSSGEPWEEELFIKHKKGYRVPVFAQAMPVIENGKTVGAVEIFNDRLPQTEKDDMMDSLTRLVMIDQLTGLSNRRHSETILDAKLREFKRFNTLFCVLLVDLDNFADCNAHYGFEAGNNVLVQVAESLRRTVRRTDFIGRWQNDEFLGVFDIKDPSNIQMIAEKLRVVIENTQHVFKDSTLQLTVSIGGAVVRGDDTVQSIIRRAEELTKQCKLDGKNRVITSVTGGEPDEQPLVGRIPAGETGRR